MSLTKELQEIKIPAWTHRLRIATPYRWWIAFSTVLGYVMLRVVLSVLYYGVITPTGLLRRFLGKDSMRTKPTSTYWISKHE